MTFFSTTTPSAAGQAVRGSRAGARSLRVRTARRAVTMGAALCLALAACSSGDETTGSGDATPQASSASQHAQNGQEQAGGAGQERTPSVTGEIVFVSGTTAQIADTDAQTAVTWTDDTAITVTSTGSLDDITVGSCVVAVAASDDADGDAAATSVQVIPAVDGSCEDVGIGGGGQGGFGGQLPDDMASGMPADMPSGMPTDLAQGGEGGDAPADMPSGMPTDMASGGPGSDFSGGGFGGTLVSGAVTAFDGTTITVDADGTQESIAVDASTVVSVQASGSADQIVVGWCAVATGDEDSTGALSAASIALTEQGDEGCTTFSGQGGAGGFGRDGAQQGGDDE